MGTIFIQQGDITKLIDIDVIVNAANETLLGGQLWWGSLSDYQKNIIKAIPNFDAEIFFECTGIKVD